jgi:multiple sugar transport system permease protein
MNAFTRARSRYLFPVAVLLPIAAWYLVFLYYPTFYSLWASLHLWVAENPSKSTFIGLKNYVELFTADPRFQKALSNTFIYVIGKAAIVIPLGMVIALLLEKLRRGTKLYVFAIFLPALCSATAIGILFNYLYQPSFGLFNAILKRLSLPSQPFLTSAVQAIYCVIITDSWAYIGFTTLIFYTGLMSLPEVFTEAARVDGAGPFRTFFQVKLPILGHTVMFIAVYTVINAFQSFDFIFVMTSSGGGTGGSSGGPGFSSYVLSLQVYIDGMLRMHIDTSTTIATVMLAIVLTLTLIQLRFLRPKWEY